MIQGPFISQLTWIVLYEPQWKPSPSGKAKRALGSSKGQLKRNTCGSTVEMGMTNENVTFQHVLISR